MTCKVSFNAKAAQKAQTLLSRKVIIRRLDPRSVRAVAGVDASYVVSESRELGVGVAVVLDAKPPFRAKACSIYIGEVCVPYIPGLLAFRELAVMAPALSKIINLADLIIVDGHGISHPRRFGIASHIGVICGKPSIGVAKKRLTGREKSVDDLTVVVNDAGEAVAAVLKRGRQRLYVSPGHLVDLPSAIAVVESLTRNKLPEPTLRADSISKAIRSILKGVAPLGAGEVLAPCEFRIKAALEEAGIILQRLRQLGLKASVG